MVKSFWILLSSLLLAQRIDSWEVTARPTTGGQEPLVKSQHLLEAIQRFYNALDQLLHDDIDNFG